MRLSNRIHIISLLTAFQVLPATWIPAQSNSLDSVTNEAPPSIRVRPGLILELAADSNLVESPVAMAFDEDGRLYVTELRDLSKTGSDDSRRGRVRLLEDTDNDGTFDTSTVFADDLDQPSTIACSRGGVFVAGATELAYLRDQDEDGIADLRRTLLSFNTSPKPGAFDVLPRGMVWGPDRRVHVTLPMSQVDVLPREGSSHLPIRFRNGGFSFNPLTMEMRAEASPGATGLSFDEAGRKFVCSPDFPLGLEILSESDVQRNPFAPELPSIQPLINAKPGVLPMDCLIYRGEAYTTNMNGCAFMADPISRSVYMILLKEGHNHPEVKTEYGSTLTSLTIDSPQHFRPMHLAVGPDDLIYIADFGQAIDAQGKLVRDGSSEGDSTPSGRIWRLSPSTHEAMTERIVFPDNPVGLAATLGNSNSWARATAARLFFETQSTNAAKALNDIWTRAKWPVAKLEALRSLDAAGVLSIRDLQQAIGSRDELIRLNSVRMTAARIQNGRISDSLLASLRTRSTDESLEIQRQVALALAGVTYPSPRILLRGIYLRNSQDVWTHRAVLTVAPENLAGLFIDLVGQPRIRNSDDGFELLEALATGVGLANQTGDVSDCLRTLLDLELDPETGFPLVVALGDGVRGAGNRIPNIDRDAFWQRIALSALNISMGNGDAALRADATRVVAACIGPEFVADEYFLLSFAPGLPEPIQIPAMEALSAQGFDRDFEALTQRWHLWAAQQQFATLNVLLQTDDGADGLLSAISDQRIPVDALSSIHINLLRSSMRDDIRARTDRIFGREQPQRDAVLSGFLDALDLQGDPFRGERLFTAQCSYCHRANGTGIGPAPRQVGSESPLQLLAGLLDPSREITPGYVTTILRLKNGHTAWGIASDTDGQVIHLRTDRGVEPFRSDAVDTFGQADWSLMPDNMAAGLDRQEIADLLAYLKNQAGQ